jgi:hypothetical protein
MLYSGYKEQYDRVKRWLERIENQNVPSLTYLDYMWAYFQNCWALKDWIKNDDSVPIAIKKKMRVEKTFFKDCPNILITADLANRSKHLTLTQQPRVGAKVESIGVTMHVSAVGSGIPARSEHHYCVVGDSGDLGDGLKIAQRAMEEWTRLLQESGLL